jgi:hypothetical protein
MFAKTIKWGAIAALIIGAFLHSTGGVCTLLAVCGCDRIHFRSRASRNHASVCLDGPISCGCLCF